MGAVIERHHGTGNIGLGLTKGFGLRSGAIAGSVGHDAHNINVVGTNDADMRACVEQIVKIEHGFYSFRPGEPLIVIKTPNPRLDVTKGVHGMIPKSIFKQ